MKNLLKEAEKHSGLNLASSAPDLLGPGDLPSDKNCDPFDGNGEELSILGLSDTVHVIKCEADEDPNVVGKRALMTEIDSLRKERKELQSRVGKYEAQISCDLSKVINLPHRKYSNFLSRP